MHRRVDRVRRFIRCLAAVGVALAAACAGERPEARDTPPPAEFLISAGDSTYWVHGTPEGIRVRSAPILLTQVDGRFYEVFIGEDGVDYADAAFASVKLWARELLRPDSLLLFADSTVLREAARWKRSNPQELPLDPEDEEMEVDPRTTVTEDLEIVDVHGPFVSVTHLLDVDLANGEAHRHEGRQWVVDVRTGHRVDLAGLLGAAEASRVVAAGEAGLRRLTDSIRTATDSRAEEARGTLDSFRFDPTSFAITDVRRRPAIAFMVPGKSAEGEAIALYLPPIEVGAPAWWASVEPTVPEWSADSGAVQWDRGTYRVSARRSDDDERLTLVLAAAGSTGGNGDAREWPVTTVAAPAYQLIALEALAADTTVREALARAFDATSALDGLTQRAGHDRRRAPAPTFRHIQRRTR